MKLSAYVQAARETLRAEYPECYADRHVDDGLWRDQERTTEQRAIREWWSDLALRAHYGDDIDAETWRSAIAADRNAALAMRARWRTVRAEVAK